MGTILRSAVAILAFVVSDVSSSAADVETATRYAEDAVASMEREYSRLETLVNEGKASASELHEKSDELLQARLIMLNLRHDDVAVSAVLLEQMERRDKEFARLNAAAGKIGAKQVQLAQLKSLQARLQYARHTRDQQLLETTLNDALVVEEAKLQSITELVRRGYESQAAIAKQKLRIATIIARQEISLP